LEVEGAEGVCGLMDALGFLQDVNDAVAWMECGELDGVSVRTEQRCGERGGERHSDGLSDRLW
jgi:hypothetical protein